MNPEELKPFFDPVKSVLREFHAEARRLGTSPLVLALSYPLQMDTIRRVVVGVVRTEELREILDGSKEFPTVDFSRFFIENNSILNPTLWERE